MALSHYYIYYPVRIGTEADLARVLHLLQADIHRETGVAGRFLRKADDPWTWMEIYENVGAPAEFERSLEQAVERQGVARFIADDGRRHTERFIPCA
ncbi:MAG: DUF4936 family protein [Proteobacteria bacterium]|nr:DUF4936 family protein [Pseudomonadota bacterium]MBS0370770.1 DUF4936 family protein [Pseudomonadota bacterium]